MKRLIALLLASSMLFSFAACSKTDESGSEKDNNDTTPAVIDEANTDGEELGEEETTPLPTAPVVDMEGRTFTIYLHQWFDYYPLWISDIIVEESTGESFNDAAYDREVAIEELLNCDVKQYEDVNTLAYRNAQAANDPAFDLLIARSKSYSTLIAEDTITSLDNLPYFDPNSPWWDAQSYEDFEIAGYHLGVVGEITTNHHLAMYGIFFNKNMVTDYGFADGDMYQLVRDGKWTLDVMFEYCRAAAMDLDGDPTTWTTNDQIGFSYVGGAPIALLNAAGVRLAEQDKDGKIVVTAGSEEALTKFTKIFELIKDDSASLNHHQRSDDAYTTEVGCFVEGRVLFNQGSFYYVPELRAMDQEFGIIPMPKYDEAQESYLSPMGADYVPMIHIPNITSDFENLSIFMEWFAYYGYDMIRPELIEVLIKGKTSRDVESIEFIEFLMDNRFYDIGASINFGDLFTTIYDIFGNRVGNLATFLPRMMKKVELAITDLEEVTIENQ